jgi:hypothetical protein
MSSSHRSPVLQVFACTYVLRPIPRRARRPSHIGYQVVFGGLRLVTGDSALALHLSRPAQASLTLRPARLLPVRSTGLCPRGFGGSVALPPPG